VLGAILGANVSFWVSGTAPSAPGIPVSNNPNGWMLAREEEKKQEKDG